MYVLVLIQKHSNGWQLSSGGEYCIIKVILSFIFVKQLFVMGTEENMDKIINCNVRHYLAEYVYHRSG